MSKSMIDRHVDIGDLLIKFVITNPRTSCRRHAWVTGRSKR